jgi:hypothetical protein
MDGVGARMEVTETNLLLAHSHKQATGSLLYARVARWFVFKPKIPIWVIFGGSCYRKYSYIL